MYNYVAYSVIFFLVYHYYFIFVRPQFFYFLFYGFSGPISDVEEEKKLKFLGFKLFFIHVE